MTKPAKKVSGISAWLNAKKQKRKEKEEQERNLEPSSLKMLTFVLTLVAMSLGMSLLPLFPQPLPILIAVLVAFVTYTKPQFGMPIGGAVIGLGLLYHLADLYFISFLGETQARVAFIVIWMALFVALPIFFKRYKSALAIDFGILAVACLFFAPTYFLAIPLILASAVFFKKYVSLTMIYYVLLTVPLQIMQYYQYTVLPIVRDEWWLEPGSSPPLLVPLTSIAKDLASSMSQFRLYDTSKVIYAIAGQTTWIPDWSGRTIGDAVKQYLDSIPGLLMFAIIVAGLALTLVFFTRVLVKEGIVGSSDRFFPMFTATLAAALFFILLSALQLPLAFTADVSPVTMVLGIVATLLLTSPVLFIDFTPKQNTTMAELREKAEALKEKLGVFENQLAHVRNNIPVDVSSPEGKVLLLKDSVNETLARIAARTFSQSDLDSKYAELDQLSKEKEAAEAELNTILTEYLIFVNGEFANSVGKLKDAGLVIKTTVKPDYSKDMSVEQRVEAIKQVLDAGRNVVEEVTAVVDPLYGIIRALYDPSLPEKCRAVEFATQKLKTKEAPWIALEAFYSSLNNWKRQYGAEIQTSMKYLEESLTPISNLSNQSEVLPFVFGENTPKVLDYAKKAEGMKALAQKRVEKEELEILDVLAFRDDLAAFLGISNEVLSMLHQGLVNEEETIDRLVPTKDYLWEKNDNLRERLKKATAVLSNPSQYKINQIMEKLPSYLSYVDEAVLTLSMYTERKEFLLNYPLAEAAIEERLKIKERLTPKDLPFDPRFAGEYLRLYYTARFDQFAFDKDMQVLTKRV
ncbi:MAG: hypothetical protein NWE98_09375 [Candidatus Bathyarchaeota archaeon]|nr:hypothetical protein [Candidatus Bathyarchaeota archaeon]